MNSILNKLRMIINVKNKHSSLALYQYSNDCKK